MAIEAGIDLLGNNPGPTNIAAGLSSIEEKSLGNVAKSGSKPIQSVLQYGEAPTSTGFHLMDAPAYAPESLTGFAIAHAQLSLFTTGVGNSFVSLLNPTIKLSANPQTTERLGEQIDFDASPALKGAQSLESVADQLVECVCGNRKRCAHLRRSARRRRGSRESIRPGALTCRPRLAYLSPATSASASILIVKIGNGIEYQMVCAGIHQHFELFSYLFPECQKRQIPRYARVSGRHH